MIDWNKLYDYNNYQILKINTIKLVSMKNLIKN